MTAENLTTSDTDTIRIATIRLSFERGLRAAAPAPDWAPWLIGGLRALEDGQDLNSELLRKLDTAQNMVLPPGTSPAKTG
jgi:hypothetical protein